MNLSTAVFLINDSARAILVNYEPKNLHDKVMYKTFDKSIKVDDFVVIPTHTRHGMTVCKVVAVDVDVDFDCSTQVSWVIGRVDIEDVAKIKEWEDKAQDAIKSAEKLKKKKELKESMEALFAASGADIKLLYAAPTAETAPTPEPEVAQ